MVKVANKKLQSNKHNNLRTNWKFCNLIIKYSSLKCIAFVLLKCWETLATLKEYDHATSHLITYNNFFRIFKYLT